MTVKPVSYTRWRGRRKKYLNTGVDGPATGPVGEQKPVCQFVLVLMSDESLPSSGQLITNPVISTEISV